MVAPPDSCAPPTPCGVSGTAGVAGLPLPAPSPSSSSDPSPNSLFFEVASLALSLNRPRTLFAARSLLAGVKRARGRISHFFGYPRRRRPSMVSLSDKTTTCDRPVTSGRPICRRAAIRWRMYAFARPHDRPLPSMSGLLPDTCCLSDDPRACSIFASYGLAGIRQN